MLQSILDEEWELTKTGSKRCNSVRNNLIAMRKLGLSPVFGPYSMKKLRKETWKETKLIMKEKLGFNPTYNSMKKAIDMIVTRNI